MKERKNKGKDKEQKSGGGWK